MAEAHALAGGDSASLIAWAFAEVGSLAFLIAALLVFAAGVMRGYSGFGGGMVLVPSLSLAYGPVAAVAIAAVLNTCVTVQLLPRALRTTRWAEILPIVLTAVVVAPFGVYVLLVVDPELMRRAIAVIVIGFVAVMWSSWRYRGRPSLGVRVALGGLSGGLTGAVGVGGPPVILYLLSGPFTAEEVRANIIMVSVFNRLGVILAFLVAGAFTGETLARSLLMVLMFLAGAWLGTHLFGRSNETVFRRVAMLFLLSVSLAALVK